jgi:uncharacterized membrane protein
MKTVPLLTFLFLAFLAGACAYEQEDSLFEKQEDDCATPVAFNTHIAPIIQTNCALSGCHAVGGVEPEFTSFEQVKARANEVKQQTQSRQMPPASSGRSLSQEEIRMIACWVNKGAPED